MVLIDRDSKPLVRNYGVEKSFELINEINIERREMQKWRSMDVKGR